MKRSDNLLSNLETNMVSMLSENAWFEMMERVNEDDQRKAEEEWVKRARLKELEEIYEEAEDYADGSLSLFKDFLRNRYCNMDEIDLMIEWFHIYNHQ